MYKNRNGIDYLNPNYFNDKVADKMKKKHSIIISVFAIVVAVIFALILLTPQIIHYDDGGTVEYKAIVYKVTDARRLSMWNEESIFHGIIIEIFGVEVYRSGNID